MGNYLSVVYNEKTKPYTDYPHQLCEYLFEKFDMERGNTVLDIGCGRGDFTKGFKDLNLEVFGIDREIVDSEMLKGIEVKSVDFEKNPFSFSPDTFDFVFSKSVIEHLYNPENFIQECYKVLKPGGKIIIMTPDWQSQKDIFYDDYTHHHPYTPTAISDLLKINNFKSVTSEIFYQLPVLWKIPLLKIFSKALQLFGPPKTIHKNKFIRWSRELMILGSGIK